MTITEIITFTLAGYLVYSSILALKWQSENNPFEGLSERKTELMNGITQTILFGGLTWGFSYIGINTIHHIYADGYLPSSIEMVWRLGHLVITTALIRHAQMILLLEHCESKAKVFWYNPKTKAFF